MSKSVVTAAVVLAIAATGSTYYLLRARSSSDRFPPSPLAAGVGRSTAPELENVKVARLRAAQAAFMRTQSAYASRPPAAPAASPNTDQKSQILANLEQGFYRLDTLSDIGAATPRAAIESFRWALTQSDVSEIARRIQLSAADKQALETILADLPPSSREAYPDAEHLMALYGARDASVVYPTKGVIEIVSEQIEAAGPDVHNAHVKTQFDQGDRDQLDQHNHEDFDLQQTPAGWKIVVPTSAAKQVAKWLTGPAEPSDAPAP